MKEDILRFIITYDYQNDGGQQMGDIPGADLKFSEKRNTACMNGTNELTSVRELESANNVKTTDMQRSASEKEMNGFNLGTV